MKTTIVLVLQTILTVMSGVFCCHPPTNRSCSTCAKLQQRLVPRGEWRALEPSGPIDCMWGPVRYVIIHHTVSGACDSSDTCSEQMRKLQRDHMTQKSWPDVGYHYVIGGDARAYAGRPCNRMGGHTRDHNRRSIGIAFLGDFQETAPPADLLDLVPEIVRCALEQGYLSPDYVVLGHRDAFCSSCPGDALYEVVSRWPRYPDVVPLPSYACDAAKETSTVDPTTTTPTTTTEGGGSNPEVKGLPVYIYLLLYKKPPPLPKCCLDVEGAWKDK